MKLLLVEDDAEGALYLKQGLTELGHVCDHVETGLDGLAAALTEPYDVIILDRNLPQMDGLNVLKAMRAEKSQTPVLLLSAMGQVDDRVTGLNAGADDYLAKPFSFQELTARLHALARRTARDDASEPQLVVGPLKLDLLTRVAWRKDRRIDLLTKEFQLLEYLMRHAGQVVTRSMLLEAVWNYSFIPGTNVIDVHISRLRAKVDAAGEQPMIQTVRGAGYRLEAG
jgi:two-component system OmpR family response regulator